MPAGRKSRPAREPLDAPALYEYAVRSLGRRMRTVAELTRLLQAKVEPGEEGEIKIAAVLTRLTEQNYLDDTRYAADFTRLRQENQRFGRRRVQQELAQRGVAKPIVEETLEAAYADLPELEQARRYIERKRLKKPTDEKQTARAVRALVRGGFSLGTAFAVLKDWQVADEALAPLEGATED